MASGHTTSHETWLVPLTDPATSAPTAIWCPSLGLAEELTGVDRKNLGAFLAGKGEMKNEFSSKSQIWYKAVESDQLTDGVNQVVNGTPAFDFTVHSAYLKRGPDEEKYTRQYRYQLCVKDPQNPARHLQSLESHRVEALSPDVVAQSAQQSSVSPQEMALRLVTRRSTKKKQGGANAGGNTETDSFQSLSFGPAVGSVHVGGGHESFELRLYRSSLPEVPTNSNEKKSIIQHKLNRNELVGHIVIKRPKGSLGGWGVLGRGGYVLLPLLGDRRGVTATVLLEMTETQEHYTVLNFNKGTRRALNSVQSDLFSQGARVLREAFAKKKDTGKEGAFDGPVMESISSKAMIVGFITQG
uniref:Uncharacterized protein n=1 Tax=Chromera velia CCMP2878 TaxID=1169474 RepID=A0A0G4I1E6_9ALVE|eukprot:Cvel_10089.t1-p1 / transcript=Cvel_10089.t1 / gene=Cvel_10089 / organism=Chromera_velia_CCMP2878 / gene_product=hypothetical protein / transcript_product=hypothetical protein / location=Cvel_scaffold601:2650-6413(-) / protein_length=355 / sequence_SO=supercontig / SO=protein_coding / is_pseudo=false